MPIQRLKELHILRRNFNEKRRFIFQGLMSANKSTDECFQNFKSPFNNSGEYAKVMFKIRTDQKGDGKMRTTFMNLHGNAESKTGTLNEQNCLTLFPENGQVAFLDAMFTITGYEEVNDDWYSRMNDGQKE